MIELILFIVATSILSTALLMVFRVSLVNTPPLHYNAIALQLADQCMEGFIGTRKLLGYSNANLACSASPPLPAVCTTITGYTVAATIVCSPTLVGDSVTSKTVTVSVSGLGNATLTTLIANY